MQLLLVAVIKNEEIWNKLFSFIFEIYLFIFDAIWNTEIPLTDIKVGYFLIFWLIVQLSIYAVNGTSTEYNNMGSSVSKAYSSAVKSGRNAKNRHRSNKVYREKQKKGK
ncbi:hypothetical protein [Spiroplasma endosymbiont of Dilophus febrilis]|uniref:hypothetical protein n=1 Tax=Spiroplasma endosymbiont of Dilophus febrilis TaxID=3066292 RepID=UPI00313C7C4F